MQLTLFQYINYLTFLVYEERGIQIRVSLACRRWPNIGLVALCFFKGSGQVLQRNPIFYDLLEGGGSGPPLDPRMMNEHQPAICKIVSFFKSTSQEQD